MLNSIRAVAIKSSVVYGEPADKALNKATHVYMNIYATHERTNQSFAEVVVEIPGNVTLGAN